MPTKSRTKRKKTTAQMNHDDMTAIIKSIEHASGIAQVIADKVAGELKIHTESDDKRFQELTVLVESISNDVKSLLGSRQFFRGAWWAVVGMAGIIGTILAAVWHYFKG